MRIGVFLSACATLATGAVGQGCSDSCYEAFGGYAPVCPGTAPRNIDGCCYRNCKSDTIQLSELSSVVRTVEEGAKNALKVACALRSDACALCDDIDGAPPSRLDALDLAHLLHARTATPSI
jgi:hypothetical protein